MLEPWLLWAWRIIAVLGLGVVLVWMGKTIKAMKGTVDAQKLTIEAQSAKMDAMERFLKAMEAVIQSTDAEAMLRRFKAYKEIVEHEKDATIKKMAVDFEQEKNTTMDEAGIERLVKNVNIRAAALFTVSLIDLASNTFPYVPKGERLRIIDSLDLPTRDTAEAAASKDGLRSVAESAPDLTVGAFGLSSLAHLASDRGLASFMRSSSLAHAPSFLHPSPPLPPPTDEETRP